VNERIRQLAIEAKLIASEPNGFDQNNLSKAQQNFAELIIQECLNICEDMGDNGKDGHYCADKITKTFYGVKL
jgi:hypothetical protein